MPAGKCQPVCAHCSTCEYTPHVRGGASKRVKRQSIQMHFLWENKVIWWERETSVVRDHLWVCKFSRLCASRWQHQPHIHTHTQSIIRACMMAEDLCKLASCVSGIQMALNLCLLSSPAQKGEKGEEGEKQEMGVLLRQMKRTSWVFLSYYLTN